MFGLIQTAYQDKDVEGNLGLWDGVRVSDLHGHDKEHHHHSEIRREGKNRGITRKGANVFHIDPTMLQSLDLG